jgi:hypothetical protein
MPHLLNHALVDMDCLHRVRWACLGADGERTLSCPATYYRHSSLPLFAFSTEVGLFEFPHRRLALCEFFWSSYIFGSLRPVSAPSSSFRRLLRLSLALRRVGCYSRVPYVGDPGFESRHGDRLPSPRFSVVFLGHLRKILEKSSN